MNKKLSKKPVMIRRSLHLKKVYHLEEEIEYLKQTLKSEIDLKFHMIEKQKEWQKYHEDYERDRERTLISRSMEQTVDQNNEIRTCLLEIMRKLGILPN